jgi:hypothetical protein
MKQAVSFIVKKRGSKPTFAIMCFPPPMMAVSGVGRKMSPPTLEFLAAVQSKLTFAVTASSIVVALQRCSFSRLTRN